MCVWCRREFRQSHDVAKVLLDGLSPLNPKISIHILYTLLYTFPLVLTRRICLTIKVSKVGNHFLYYYHELP